MLGDQYSERARRGNGPGDEPFRIAAGGLLHGVDGRLTRGVFAFADSSEIERMHEELRVLRSIATAP